MDNGNVDGGLDGHSMGTSSRDGERHVPKQRRSKGSGGFLLDSPFTSPAKLFSSLHRSQRSDIRETRQRATTQHQTVPSKKKSRRPWYHRKSSLGNSPLATTVINVSAAEENIQHQPESRKFLSSPATLTNPSSEVSNSPAAGFDTDPAQIVNLALNLSETRRRSYGGRLPSTPASGGGIYGFIDSRTQRPGVAWGQSSSLAHRHSSYIVPENRLRKPHSSALVTRPETTWKNSTLRPNPGNREDNLQLTYTLSEATLARAAKARNHFNLFYEYIRVLTYLPPFRRPTWDSATSGLPTVNNEAPASRAYNPLQCIRNRKVRFRERRPIDTEADGWYDVSRVREWVTEIENSRTQLIHDSNQCMKLPPFQHQIEMNTVNHEQNKLMASPSSSSKRLDGTTSMKPRRPRLDWIISPAELLADAAWLEEGINRAKIIDKDGNRLYPNQTDFKLINHITLESTSSDRASMEEKRFLAVEELGPRPTVSGFNHTEIHEESLDRGRHRHKLRTPSRATRSSSGSQRGKHFRWTGSTYWLDSPSSSSAGEEVPRGRSRRLDWDNRDSNKLERASIANAPILQKFDPGNPKQDKETLRGTYRKHTDPVYTQSPQIHDFSENPTNTKQSHKPRSSLSSTLSTGDRENGRLSLEDMDSTAPNSPLHSTLFPSITVSLSPPPSRSPSPKRGALPRVIGALHERNRSKKRNNPNTGDSIEDSSPETRLLGKSHITDLPSHTDYLKPAETSASPEHLSPNQRYQGSNGMRKLEGPRGQRQQIKQESKLRGLFKGGRIAEIVGNEVFRVGDAILKRDGASHSRRSSYASSLLSDGRVSEDENPDGGFTLEPKSKQTNEVSRTFIHRSPAFASRSRHTSRDSRPRSMEPASYSAPQIHLTYHTTHTPLDTDSISSLANVSAVSPSSDVWDRSTSIGGRRDSYGFGPALSTVQGQDQSKKQQAIEASTPSEASQNITNHQNGDIDSTILHKKRPRLSNAAYPWNISDRNVTNFRDLQPISKREILRLQALLLSSGVKAREIGHQVEALRSNPSSFLVRSMAGPQRSMPQVASLEEFAYASKNLVQRFENTKAALHRSMIRSSKSTSPLKSELEHLETLVNRTLTPRARAAAAAAEDLSTELTTTSTLAVKQLSDTLNKGIRKRNRRFRWVRRVGFVLLEWVVVGVMWWVWLVVMIFKVTRGVWRGTISGIRWVLWL